MQTYLVNAAAGDTQPLLQLEKAFLKTLVLQLLFCCTLTSSAMQQIQLATNRLSDPPCLCADLPFQHRSGSQVPAYCCSRQDRCTLRPGDLAWHLLQLDGVPGHLAGNRSPGHHRQDFWHLLPSPGLRCPLLLPRRRQHVPGEFILAQRQPCWPCAGIFMLPLPPIGSPILDFVAPCSPTFSLTWL